MRLLCEHLKIFPSGRNPCRKVLCEIEGKITEKTDEQITIKGEGKIVLKCGGCGRKTTILIMGGK